jgi:hypothetical protein
MYMYMYDPRVRNAPERHAKALGILVCSSLPAASHLGSLTLVLGQIYLSQMHARAAEISTGSYRHVV